MPAGAECVASIVRLVYCTFTVLLREWLGGQGVSVWRFAMAFISTFVLIARMLARSPRRRQHVQPRAPGAAPVPEDYIVKETMLHLEMNYNKIASLCSRACGKGDTAKEWLKELRTLPSA